jgi:hypothetical protein
MIQTTNTRKQSRGKIRTQICSESSEEVSKPAVHEPSHDSSMKESNIRFDDVVSLTGVKYLARRLPPAAERESSCSP